MFSNFDGTGRPPRQVQLDAFEWLRQNLGKQKFLAIQAPCGSGKQALARTLQLELGGHYITPSNILLNQCLGTYPGINCLKGVSHYQCRDNPDITCQEKREVVRCGCTDCHYTATRKRALQGEPTIFNPLSYYYLTFSEKFIPPELIVVDEAHNLLPMLFELVSHRFPFSKYKWPNSTNLIVIRDWLIVTARKYERASWEYQKQGFIKKAATARGESKKLTTIAEYMYESPQNWVIYTERGEYKKKPETFLWVKPTHVPQRLIQSILCSQTVVLMSATLSTFEVEAITGGAPYAYLDLPSPIPKEQQPVLFRPAQTMNYETPVEEIADWVKEQIRAFPGRNTLIHVTYALSNKLRRLFPRSRFNTPEDKDAVLADFKKKGGIWFAAGCAEGLDLPGDECRLNLIPSLYRINIMDPWVKKRMSLADGQLWYDMQTLQTLQQQAGRSTRSETDSSIIVVGDPALPRIVTRHKNRIPQSFRDRIIWAKGKTA
jgi:Rad3-related DNA helicase